MTRNIAMVIVVVVIVSFGGYLVYQFMKPQPFHWTPTYRNIDKEPYGTWVLFSQLRNFFPGKKVKSLKNEDLEIYFPVKDETLTEEYSEEDYQDDYYQTDTIYVGETAPLENWEEDTTFSVEYWEMEDAPHFNIFFLGPYFSAPKVKMSAILQHAYQGNHVFIGAPEFEPYLLNFLGLKINSQELVHLDDDETKNEFRISVYDDDAVAFKPYSQITFFSEYQEDVEIIATNEEGRAIGVSIEIGKGTVTLFSLPILFTNYYVLKQDRRVVNKLLAELPLEDTYWAQYISNEPYYKYPEQRSMLTFIHSQESLMWAFYTLLFSLLIFFILQIRRKQKMIPIVSKPQNTSVSFNNTLSNLYMYRQDNRDILQKKMNFFLMRIRNKYNLDTSRIDEDFMKKLSVKTKVKLGVVKLLFYRYDNARKQSFLSKEDFLEVNKIFQDFKISENE